MNATGWESGAAAGVAAGVAWRPDPVTGGAAGAGRVRSTGARTVPLRPRLARRTLTILAADVAGYCRLVELDDAGTALRLRHFQERIVGPLAATHRGRVVDRAGDAILLSFDDAARAVACALALEARLASRERAAPAYRRMQVRVGIDSDEVVAIEGRLYGRPLNLASRLQALAEPGGIVLSEACYERLPARDAARCEPLGERRLRHIAAPVRLYRVVPGAAPSVAAS